MTLERLKRLNGEGFKHTFEPNPEAIIINRNQVIVDHLLEKCDKFTLLNNGHSELTILGEIGETGLIITDSKERIVAAVKHPNVTPSKLDSSIGLVEFGGETDTTHIEPMLEIPVGEERAAIHARLILNHLRNGESLELVAENMSGVYRIGSEPEAWLINPDTGDLEPISAGELQQGLLEETLDPIADPNKFLVKRAKYTLDRAEKNKGILITDLSVLPTSSPDKIIINTGHELGPYVFAIQHWLMKNYFTFSDPLAEELMNTLSQSAGFDNHRHLIQETKNMGHWVNAASHGSFGLNHLREGISAQYTPTEAAIAISDVFNSDLATVAEFLMFSTPIIFNQTPTVNEEWPRDYRTILRYLMDTSNPADFIKDTNTMYTRITKSITEGLSHTVDRCSYIAEANGRPVPVMHGRVRNRATSHEPRNQTGRIELTGCSNSPSILDEQARNAFMQILATVALEAVENKQHPIDYLGKKFPHLTTWNKQKDLAINASLFGFHYPEVKSVIQESLQLIEYVEASYPSLTEIADIATRRIQNLSKPAVNSLKEYLVNPQGSISEAIQNEIKAGATGLDIARSVHQYQLSMSNQILALR